MGLCPKPQNPLKRIHLNFIKIILTNDFRDNIVFKFCINLNSRYFQNCVKTEQHSCEGQQFLVTLACPERRERERGKSDFAILRASSLAKTALRLVKPQNDFVKLPIGRKVQLKNCILVLLISYCSSFIMVCCLKFIWIYKQ